MLKKKYFNVNTRIKNKTKNVIPAVKTIQLTII